MNGPSVLRSVAFVLLGSAGCITPLQSSVPPASPGSRTASPEETASTSDETLDPARIYALQIERSARLVEKCERGTVDLDALTDAATYFLQFQAHPVRDAALAGLETCRQSVLERADEVLAELRPSMAKTVAGSLEDLMRESLELLDLKGEVRVEHDGASLTLIVEIPKDGDSLMEPGAFESLCGFVQRYGVETLTLLYNGERTECSPPFDIAAFKALLLEELNLSTPWNPPPSGDQPVPIE